MELLKWIPVLTLFMNNLHAGTCRILTNTTESLAIDKHDAIVAELKDLKVEVEELKELRKSYTRMSHDIVEMKEKMQAFHIRDPGPNDVYFTVVLLNDVRGLGPGETVVYDSVLTNGGNGYDTKTGVFTVPTTGVYLFEFFCNSLKAKNTDLVMMRNGDIAANCVVEPDYNGEDETGGDVFIDRLFIGDRVWVEVFSSETSNADLQANFNTFAGVLIHRGSDTYNKDHLNSFKTK